MIVVDYAYKFIIEERLRKIEEEEMRLSLDSEQLRVLNWREMLKKQRIKHQSLCHRYPKNKSQVEKKLQRTPRRQLRE